MAENSLELGKRKFVTIRIDFTKDFPVTIFPNTPDEVVFPSLTELIHPDDIPPMTEMFTKLSDNNMESFEAHCRFPVSGDFHWFFLCCRPVNDEISKIKRFVGTMVDVSNYLETAGDDLVYKEFKKKHNIKLNDLNSNQISLADVLDADYLAKIQKPFCQTQGLYSGIYNSNGDLISSPRHQTSGQKPEHFLFQRKKNIRINHIVSAYWLIASNSQSQLDENAQLQDTLAQTVSKIANAFVVVYDEMQNSQNANKLLGQNVEEQILLNNIYAIIMESKTSKQALADVMKLVGEYMSFDRIITVDAEKTNSPADYIWENEATKGFFDNNTIQSISETAFPELTKELEFNNTYFSSGTEHEMAKFGVKSFAIAQLFENGNANSVILYECIHKEHTWSQRDRKQLKNISQIISSIFMRANTEKKLAESKAKLKQVAFKDSILNIQNRARLNKDLNKLLKKSYSGALIAFKITNMRSISAVYGHSYADMLLRSIAQYLNDMPLENKSAYYYTNSIFMINLKNGTANHAKQLAETLIYRFTKPWIMNDNEHFIHCSIGISFYPVNGRTSEEICKSASLAMYRAREFKHNSYTFYARGLEQSHATVMNIEQHIKQDIFDNMNGFSLKFQPVFSLKDGQMISCESLIRWTNKEIGHLPNSSLLPMVENMGLFHLLDKWVLKNSCVFCKEMQDSGRPDFKISVNLSSSEIQSKDVVDYVSEALEESGLEPSSLILEMPVKAISAGYSDSAHIMTMLHELGVSIAIDNYGTEQISLKMLKNSYISIVNLDKDIVLNTDDQFDQIITNTVIDLCHARNIRICVKGIEDYNQLSTVQKCDIDCVQGYFCSHPLTKEETMLSSLQQV